MHSTRQGTLFQHGLEPPQKSYTPDPQKVRNRMHAILADLESGNVADWQPANFSMWRTVFPNMGNWLPQDERAALIARFETAMQRYSTIN